MSQEEKVLNHLKKHGEITSWTAIMDYGITRLSARIFRLREQGYQIETEIVCKKKGEETVRFARYTMK